MKRIFALFFTFSYLVFCADNIVEKPLSIVTTLSILGELVKEIGKDQVIVKSLLNANADPHSLAENPSFKFLIKNADGFVEIGKGLEPWANGVINSSNPKILRLKASLGLSSLQIPKSVSRKSGDVHGEGNPHVWLSPPNAQKMAESIKAFLIKLRPKQEAYFNSNFSLFKEKLSKAFFGDNLFNHFKKNQDLLWRLYEGGRLKSYLLSKKWPEPEGWLKLGKSINYNIIAFHDTWPYFSKDFPLNIVGHFEEYPGSSTTIKHINLLKKIGKEKHVKLILVESYNISKKKEIDSLAKDIEAKAIFLPVDCKENEDYFSFISRILNTLKNV